MAYAFKFEGREKMKKNFKQVPKTLKNMDLNSKTSSVTLTPPEKLFKKQLAPPEQLFKGKIPKRSPQKQQ